MVKITTSKRLNFLASGCFKNCFYFEADGVFLEAAAAAAESMDS
jgi:hypothetical protein